MDPLADSAVGGREVYNYFRDYDPRIGRYIESDPIGLEGGVNTYSYVDAGPLAFVDPLGLSKGGKRNLNTEGFTKKSDPKDVQKALDDAKQQGNKPRIRALSGLLKVIKRGGTLGLLCGMADDYWKCVEDPCSCNPTGYECLTGPI